MAVEARGTSQECSHCGGNVPKTLADRIHRCPCGYTADRHANAARVILARGLGRSFGEGAGSPRCPKIREAAGLDRAECHERPFPAPGRRSRPVPRSPKGEGREAKRRLGRRLSARLEISCEVLGASELALGRAEDLDDLLWDGPLLHTDGLCHPAAPAAEFREARRSETRLVTSSQPGVLPSSWADGGRPSGRRNSVGRDHLRTHARPSEIRLRWPERAFPRG